VADVLPAVQKIAERARVREREKERVGERRIRERGCEVLYDGGKCTSLPVFFYFRNGCCASEEYGCLLKLLFLPFLSRLSSEGDMV